MSDEENTNKRTNSYSEPSQRKRRKIQPSEEDKWFIEFMTYIPPLLQTEWIEYTKTITSLTEFIELAQSYNPQSNIKYYFPHERLHQLVEPLTELNQMIGMTELKENLLNHILFFCQDLESKHNAMMHTVIYGPPGSGKTHVAGILAKIYARMGFLKTDKIHSVKRSDLIGQYLGQTAVKTQTAINNAKGGILLIDEAYSLGNEEGKDIYSKECIDTLCQNLSEGKGEFICIIIGYKESLEKCFFSYNPGLERRFPYRYTMIEYTAEQLWFILCKMIKENGWNYEETLQIKAIEFLEINRVYFKFNGGDMELFFHELKIAHGKRVFGRHPSIYKIFTWDDWNYAFELFLKNEDVKKRKETFKEHLSFMYT